LDFIRASCVVCGGDDLTYLASIPSVPVLCNQVLRDPASARKADRASIELVGCGNCGHMFNVAFDPERIDYNAAYENSLFCSTQYRRYTDEIVERIRAGGHRAGETVVEIGCGRGEFLRILCEHGFKRGIGFDPARPDEQATVAGATLSIVGGTFDSARARNADVVCSRHVLEHLLDPVALLCDVQAAYKDCPPRLIFLEVPNGSFTLRDLGVWDLIYEHVSYFTSSSMSYALSRAGLVPLVVESVFGEQFLIAEATFIQRGQRVKPVTPPATLLSEFSTFGSRFGKMVEEWRRWLDDARRSGLRLALWGSGSKGVTFLNLLDRGSRPAIPYVIDSNPLKQGAFVAGTGHPIRSPAAIAQDRPIAILLMNGQYEREIRRMLVDLGQAVEIIVVSGELPPSVLPSELWRGAVLTT
jgi:SAM-dependent methyltransferase